MVQLNFLVKKGTSFPFFFQNEWIRNPWWKYKRQYITLFGEGEKSIRTLMFKKKWPITVSPFFTPNVGDMGCYSEFWPQYEVRQG